MRKMGMEVHHILSGQTFVNQEAGLKEMLDGGKLSGLAKPQGRRF